MISTAIFELSYLSENCSEFVSPLPRLPGQRDGETTLQHTRLSQAHAFGVLERLIAVDPGQRDIQALVRPGELLLASRLLLQSEGAELVTGFYIPAAQGCETDGPPGALALGRALQKLGKHASYLTDDFCAPALRQAGMLPLHGPDAMPLTATERRPLVSIERVGRAGDLHYYNMRGEDISAFTGPLDAAFLNRNNAPWTIGVGDGGNEIGMGRVRAEVQQHVRHGETIGSVVSTAQLVVAGTSNWGAWGLVAGLSILSGRDLLPSDDLALHDLTRLVEAGAVDGVTRRREATVDGLPWSTHLSVLGGLRRVVGRYLRQLQFVAG